MDPVVSASVPVEFVAVPERETATEGSEAVELPQRQRFAYRNDRCGFSTSRLLIAASASSAPVPTCLNVERVEPVFPRKSCPVRVKYLRRRNHCHYLVRIGTFDPVRLDGCGYVIVGLTGLNRTVAVIHRRVHGRINLRERPSAGNRAVHVISDD